MSKQMWNTLKVKSGGVTRIYKAYVQYLKRDYENIFMDEDHLILDFFDKLSCVVNELRSPREVIADGKVASML